MYYSTVLIAKTITSKNVGFLRTDFLNVDRSISGIMGQLVKKWILTFFSRLSDEEIRLLISCSVKNGMWANPRKIFLYVAFF